MWKASRNFTQSEARPFVPVMWGHSYNLLCERRSVLVLAPGVSQKRRSGEQADVLERYLGHWKKKRRKQKVRHVYNQLLCKLNWHTSPFQTKSIRSGCLSGPGILNPQEQVGTEKLKGIKGILGGPEPGCVGGSGRRGIWQGQTTLCYSGELPSWVSRLSFQPSRSEPRLQISCTLLLSWERQS